MNIHHGGGASAGVTPGKTALLLNNAGEGRAAVCVGNSEPTPGMSEPFGFERGAFTGANDRRIVRCSSQTPY